MNKQISAIILSAGYSSRMKAFKPLLPFGKKTIIEHVINTFQFVNIESIIVVTGHNHEILSEKINDQNIIIAHNKEFDKGMFSSVKVGVEKVKNTHNAFFIMPVDYPMVQKITIEQMINVFESKKTDVLYPSFNNRKGHPPLINTNLIPSLKDWVGDGGLREFLKPVTASYIIVEDKNVLFDIDTPYDYQLAINSKLES